ncbi:hypothetical protein B296_00036948 [Ensete ventricosum]|uniref:Uncharacterized protein n=1 Tax=Ensete ventricosum TaxID=4639 RepID=A0A426YGM8_ENSVE|nr:hypothetical protein B296_00036948 [Ensete ventricosum]
MLEPNLVPAQWIRPASVEHCWFRPLCASSPVVVSGRSRCSARWMDPSYPVTGVGCWSGGAREGRRRLRSGRAPVLARRSGAYIVSDVGHPYLATLLPLWLTMSSYPSTTPTVLAVGHTTAGVSTLPVSASRVGSAMSVGQLSEGASTWRPGQHLPYHNICVLCVAHAVCRDILDGSSVQFVEILENELPKLREKGIDAQIASGGGQMYVTMDRYEVSAKYIIYTFVLQVPLAIGGRGLAPGVRFRKYLPDAGLANVAAPAGYESTLIEVVLD